jgi:hypothetical protein
MALGQRLYLAGVIELHESLSKQKLENALTSLKDHDILASQSGNLLSLAAPKSPRESVKELETRLMAFLR